MMLAARILFGLAASLLLVVPYAAAHDMDGHDKHEPAPLGAGAALDAQGRVWLVTVRDGHVRVQRSDDHGKTFGKPVVVNPVAERIYASGENRPKIALGPQGQVYVQWTQKTSAGWTGAIRFARSTDGGQSFAEPVTVHQDRTKETRGFASLALARNGDLLVLWVDARDQAKAKQAGAKHRGFGIYYSWSHDAGRSFVPERRLADHSCECCRTAATVTPDGEVATLFRSVYADNVRDHTFAVLAPGGMAAKPQRATFSEWQIPACPDQGPGLAIGADGVRHAVWYEASDGPTIWYGQLEPEQPARHKRKIGAGGAGHADVAVQGDTVWVVWNQVGIAGYSLMLRTSRDGGLHFGPQRVLADSNDAVGSPQLLVHDGRAWVAWSTQAGFRLLSTEEK